MLSMSKMSKIDQIHLRAVMLCMSKMGKEHTDTFFIRTFLIWYHLNVMLSMSKMLKIDQIHLRAVMLCMLKMSKMDQIHLRAVMLCMSKMWKMGKEHTHTFWLMTSFIFNGFSIRKSFGKLRLRAFQTYYQILCMSKHVKDVKDYLRHLRHALIYTVFGWKALSLSFPKLFSD